MPSNQNNLILISCFCFSSFRNGHSNITSSHANLNLNSHTAAGVSLHSKALVCHQPSPMTPVFTAIGFEVFYVIYGLLALFSQYVNIYKTVGVLCTYSIMSANNFATHLLYVKVFV